MNRPSEKVKDFVEPKQFEIVETYVADPRRALGAYLFTAATSDLLARWLDVLAGMTNGKGLASALAGGRGVGKSHTLAAFGALAENAEARAAVNDPHVAAAAQRLASRAFLVIRVERGLRPTLAAELAYGAARAFADDEAAWQDLKPVEVLHRARQLTGNAPLVILIDTAQGRAARVRRDDGHDLAELARACQIQPVFIGLALDDDIAGADGLNVEISATYKIDYLAAEHLYALVDLYVFQKTASARAALRDLCGQLRVTVPGFKWSEERFVALYPIHPHVAEIASVVRLHAPNFALLSFAVGAGARAANRPALSLVVLDDVFDRAEYQFRKASELTDALMAYDALAQHAIVQIPVMQRLQAKLILKGLFVLSLDGRGATAEELGAAMLLFDEADQAAGITRIHDILERFAEAQPHAVVRSAAEGAAARYRFDISVGGQLEQALAARLELPDAPQSATDLTYLWQQLARGQFADWILGFASETEPTVGANPLPPDNPPFDAAPLTGELSIFWRGTSRAGWLEWRKLSAAGELELTPRSAARQMPFDWNLCLIAPSLNSGAFDFTRARVGTVAAAHDTAPPATDEAELSTLVVWRPASLTADEDRTLRYLHLLDSDASFVQKFGTAAQELERDLAARGADIWRRVYLTEGAFLTLDGDNLPFPVETHSATKLAHALESPLTPFLQKRYPLHPRFHGYLGEGEVALIVGGLFSGARAQEIEVQQVAREFAAPLGLVAERGGVLLPETGDAILQQPWVREALALTDAADGAVVPHEVVFRRLRGTPFGLLRRSQHIILAALVAQRRIDLITSTGDRISRRTLDLRIRWDDIAGVARVETVQQTAEQLTTWARLLTERPELEIITTPDARAEVREALFTWGEKWRARAVLERLDEFGEEGLTTRISRLAYSVRRSFGVVADAITDTLANQISLEEGLQAVADAFVNSPAVFARYRDSLRHLTDFVRDLPEREKARAYIWLAEFTAEPEIEAARREWNELAADIHSLLDTSAVMRGRELWHEFQSSYTRHYVAEHMRYVTEANTEWLDEWLRGEEWREFAALARLPLINRAEWREAQALIVRARRAGCRLPVENLLQTQPVCGCGFRLHERARLANLPAELRALTLRGRDAARRVLLNWGRPFAQALNAYADSAAATDESATTARRLADNIELGILPEPLTDEMFALIADALTHGGAPALRLAVPAQNWGLMTRAELGARLQNWLDELPDYPALLDVAAQVTEND